MKIFMALILSLSAITSFVAHAENGSKRLHELHLQNVERGTASSASQE